MTRRTTTRTVRMGGRPVRVTTTVETRPGRVTVTRRIR